MARAASTAEEIEAVDEELVYHLGRGADLLAKGETDAARASLERALQIRPKDAKALGLLGQSYYKLGRYEDAATVYGRLVDDNPVESAARVNLGLACLKAKRYPDAVKQLEIALDLNPEHKRAMGYLGLALFEANQVEAARSWFLKAGSEAMAARCDEVLAGGRVSPQLPMPEAAPEPPSDAAAPEPIHTPPPLPVYRHAGNYPTLGAYAASRTAGARGDEPFTEAAGALVVSVRGEVLVRMDGLFAVRGSVKLAPEMKRFRGRATDKPFGEGAARMVRASGEGALLYRSTGRRFVALDLGSDAAYFREEVIFALEEPVVFENGRVPFRPGADLNLVHLRGRGRFLLATRAEPVSVEATPQAPVRVPLEALVGWVGALTPKVTALAEGEGADAVDAAGAIHVELSGEGRVLVDPDAAAGGRR